MNDKPTDKELYELAKDVSLYGCCRPDEIERLKILQNAVLKRFKPREPRVVERWVRIDSSGNLAGIYSIKGDAKIIVKQRGGYLAKAVITEVIEE